MRALRFTLTLSVVAIATACQQGGGLDYDQAALDTENQRASYSLGLDYGRQLSVAGDRIDMAALVRGLRDAMEERDPALSDPEMMGARNAFAEAVRAEIAAEQEATATANQAEGEQYIAEYAAQEGVMSTGSGLHYEVLEAADGPTPGPTDNVTIHYTGTLIDGTEFDSSRDGDPATFNVGQVIPGFSEGLQLMQVGSTYRFVIPGDIGYGPQGTQGLIGPNQTLIFEVELLEIQPTG